MTVSGASYAYDDTTGAISLSNPTGNVAISATCPAVTASFTITGNITNGTLTGATSVTGDNTVTCTIVPSAGYTLPASADLTVTGATGTYNDQTGEISISHASADITVTATCPAEQQGMSAIAVNDQLTEIAIDDTAAKADVLAVLETLTYDADTGVCPLVEGTDTTAGSQNVLYAMRAEEDNTTYYLIFAVDSYDDHDGAHDELLFSSANAIGWENGVSSTLSLSGYTPTVTAVDSTAGWNGVIFGK